MTPFWLKAKYQLYGSYWVRLPNGRLAKVVGFRQARFGPALRLVLPGEARVSDGWDPATVTRIA